MRTRQITTLALTLLAPAALLVTGCDTAPKTEVDRQSLSADVQATLTRFKGTDPSLKPLLTGSKGYAVFPDIGKGGFIIGGAYGKGEVFTGDTRIGFCDVSQGSIGFQAGAQSYSTVLVFLTDKEFLNFKSGNYTFAANVSAVALAAGAAAQADYAKGVVVLVETRGGLMAEAAVGGQKYTYKPLN